MDKTKGKKTLVKRINKKKTGIKQYALQKIEMLSWLMGKKLYSSREELYDR
ncbi:MAG: hypothetical protein M1391_06355 [Bacteroidetes bacterium]|nr:hypothetical protein [Bacteroidota bacterium]